MKSAFASSQAPAWEFSFGSSSFPSREAGASPSGFPIWRLGTSAKSLEKVGVIVRLDHPAYGGLLARIRLTAL